MRWRQRSWLEMHTRARAVLMCQESGCTVPPPHTHTQTLTHTHSAFISLMNQRSTPLRWGHPLRNTGSEAEVEEAGRVISCSSSLCLSAEETLFINIQSSRLWDVMRNALNHAIVTLARLNTKKQQRGRNYTGDQEHNELHPSGNQECIQVEVLSLKCSFCSEEIHVLFSNKNNIVLEYICFQSGWGLLSTFTL